MIWLPFLIYLAVARAQNATGGTKDCNTLPQYKKIIGCCKFPNPKWDYYSAQCAKYNNGFQKLSNPCIIDCVFNASNVMSDGVINLANARSMISNLYADRPEFIPAYYAGMDKCQERIKQMLSQMPNGDRRLKMRGPSNCRSLPLLYVVCAHKEAFTNCPASAWTNSTECENAKYFSQNCEHKWGGGKKRF